MKGAGVEASFLERARRASQKQVGGGRMSGAGVGRCRTHGSCGEPLGWENKFVASGLVGVVWGASGVGEQSCRLKTRRAGVGNGDHMGVASWAGQEYMTYTRTRKPGGGPLVARRGIGPPTTTSTAMSWLQSCGRMGCGPRAHAMQTRQADIQSTILKTQVLPRTKTPSISLIQAMVVPRPLLQSIR